MPNIQNPSINKELSLANFSPAKEADTTSISDALEIYSNPKKADYHTVAISDGETALLPFDHSAFNLFTVAKYIENEQDASKREQIKAWLNKHKFTFGFTAVNAFPTGVGYWYSNMSNTSLSFPIRAYLTGPTCASINILFNGKYIGALVADAYNLIKSMKVLGWEAVGATRTEAAVNTLAALGVYLLGVSASLPYAASTIDGNIAAETHHVNLSPESLDIINNVFIAINSMLYFPALFDYVRTYILNPIFRTKAEREWIAVQKRFKQEIISALTSRNPKKIARAFKKLESLQYKDFNAFKQSLIRQYHDNSTSNGEDFLEGLAIAISIGTGGLFYIGTSGLITQATKIPGLSSIWTWFVKLSHADLYPVACIHNFTNLAFAVKNAHAGVHTISRLFERAFYNFDQTALCNYPVNIPYISTAMDYLATTGIGRPIVNCMRNTPFIAILAMAISLGLLFISAGTSLAQAGDGLSGAPFNATETASWIINGGAATNAFFVNSSEVALPVFLLGTAFGAMILSPILFLLSGCQRSEPLVIEASEAEEFVLNQILNGPLAANDEKSFQDSLKTPFFRQLKAGIQDDPSAVNRLEYTPPQSSESGSEPDNRSNTSSSPSLA